MIKKLSELKISPAPWEAGVNPAIADVLDGYVGKCIYAKGDVDKTPYVGWANVVNGNTEAAIRNARLMAAAPKLYDRAQKLVAAFDRREMTPEHIEALRAALAEAAGEEANDGNR